MIFRFGFGTVPFGDVRCHRCLLREYSICYDTGLELVTFRTLIYLLVGMSDIKLILTQNYQNISVSLYFLKKLEYVIYTLILKAN